MRRLRLLPHLLLACAIFYTRIHFTEALCAGMVIPFDMVPNTDHMVRVGESLDIYCVLNKSHPDTEGLDSRNITYDVRNHDEYEQSIVNETTIKLHLENPKATTYPVHCVMSNATRTLQRCLQTVFVGYLPQEVDNFTCISINWQTLNCSWTPKPNPVKTTYKFEISYPGDKKTFSCPKDTDINQNFCQLAEFKDNYRQVAETINFHIIGRNALGVFKENRTVDHHAIVLPGKPENLNIINQTVSSVSISWSIPFPLSTFDSGLKFNISYKSEYDEDWKTFQAKNETTSRAMVIRGKSPQNYTLKNLPYANTNYSLLLYLQSAKAPRGKLFSEPAFFTFKTLSKRPQFPPKTTSGCFDVVSQANGSEVFVYWTKLAPYEECGDEFFYNVTCVKDNKYPCDPPLETNMTYARFHVESNSFYNFTITPHNVNGSSDESSYVYVPDERSVPLPKGFTKHFQTDGSYMFSWNPVNHPRLSNYTLFWCEDDTDRPIPCKGYLRWIHIDREIHTHKYMPDPKKFYKFALSANLEDGSSSGMVWSSCSINNENELRRMVDFHLSNSRHDGFDVIFEFTCTPNSAKYGWIVNYCVGKPPHCNWQSKEVGSQNKSITLDNLKPYTTYHVKVSVKSTKSFIELGVKNITTEEGVPSVPPRLKAINVTNTSVFLYWFPPAESNGIIRSYLLEASENGRSSLTREVNGTNFSWINLKSYTKYNFTVKACTTYQKCSSPSKAATVFTKAGTPGQMHRPQIIVIGSYANVSWEVPHNMTGPIDYYELSIQPKDESEIILKVEGLNKTVELDCKTEKKTPEFRVRAISISENKTLYGPWSAQAQTSCSQASPVPVIASWIVGIVVFFFISAVLVSVIKKRWVKCRKMKELEIKLPPGLQNQDLEKSNQDYRWPPRSGDGNSGSLGAVVNPDEESLLDKKSDESLDMTPFNMPRKNGGDSSGCSVGRGSVSSSTISDPPVSSDSGAEADQCMAGPKDPCLNSWDSMKKRSSLKDRKNQNAVVDDTIHFENEATELNTFETTTPGYTRVGVTNSPDKNFPAKGYVTIASVTSANAKSSDASFNMLPAENFSKFFEEKPTTASAAGKAFARQVQPTIAAATTSASTPPRYITLSLLQEQRSPDSTHSGERCRTTEFQQIEERGDEVDEASGDSREDDSSGTETETDTVHAMPISMPPYVTMFENHLRKSNNDEEEEEDEDDDDEEDEEEEDDPEEEKEEDEEENDQLRPSDSPCRKTVKEIEGLVDKRNLESNYIPHSMFGKESVQT